MKNERNSAALGRSISDSGGPCGEGEGLDHQPATLPCAPRLSGALRVAEGLSF